MKSILIVDDKPEIAKIIMIYLSSSYQVVYMENPVKAISWMNEGNIPDGIISDLNMPEIFPTRRSSDLDRKSVV